MSCTCPGWLADAERCQVAGVPDRVGFAAKPQLARVMLDRVLEAGVPAGWVTAEEVYGADRGLRGWLEARQLAYVLAVKRTEPLTLPSGPPVPAARLAARIPPACWLRVSAGQGAKGRRWYAWSHLPLASTAAAYLVAAAVAAASPTPGGLVAMEAALVVGLTAAGAPAGPAVAGVLAFRLLTFWLPILPGWLAYRRLRAAETI